MTSHPKDPKRGIFAKPGALIAVIIGIIVAIMVAHHSRAATSYPAAPTARFTITVTGTGQDIILIPGLGSSAEVWNQTVAQFNDRYRLHVLNLSGFAGTPAGSNSDGAILTPSVEALDAYIKANHLQNPTIVGHSLGGLMGLILAKDHPEDLSKLIIVDALPFAGLMYDPNATVAAMTPQVSAMRDALIATPQEAFAAQQASGTARLVSKPADIETVAAWSVASDRRVFAESFYEDMTTDVRPDLPRITTPVVVIVPVASHYGQTTEAVLAPYKASYAPLPNVSITPIDKSLHFVMLDQPEAFAKALEAALK